MNQPWKLIVLLVGIFAAGGATGMLIARRMPQVMPPKAPPTPELWATLHLKRIVDDVGVPPAQMEQIRPVVQRGMLELFNMRSQFLADNRARREQMEREVRGLLTPAQQLEYDKINREFLERSRRLERSGKDERKGHPAGESKRERDGERPPPPGK